MRAPFDGNASSLLKQRPTYFEPIIQKTAEFAAQAHSSEHKGTVYYVMLIITDGEIHDMPKVKNAIVAASHLPMSIIIVGVGNADFTNMQILDGDGEILKDSRGQRAERDIVQFVRSNPSLCSNVPCSPRLLFIRIVLFEEGGFD